MKNNKITTIMLIVMIISYIFNTVALTLNKNISLSIGLMLYAFSFLLCICLQKNNNINECKKEILKNSIYFLFFMFITSILCSFNIGTQNMLSIRDVFAPNPLNIFNATIYIPNLINIITYVLVYYLSHYIFFVTYDVLIQNVNYIISFFVAILISIILDQMIYTTVTNLIPLLNDIITTNSFVKELTNNFFICLISSIVLTILCPLINIIKSKKEMN